MGKVLQLLSFLSLGILCIGTAVAPDSSAFWLASNGTSFEVMRIVLMVVMLAQLVTKPPRHLIFRLLAGGLAGGVLVWVWNATYNYQMPFLDTLAFVAAALAVGITALERRNVPVLSPLLRQEIIVRSV